MKKEPIYQNVKAVTARATYIRIAGGVTIASFVTFTANVVPTRYVHEPPFLAPFLVFSGAGKNNAWYIYASFAYVGLDRKACRESKAKQKSHVIIQQDPMLRKTSQ